MKEATVYKLKLVTASCLKGVLSHKTQFSLLDLPATIGGSIEKISGGKPYKAVLHQYLANGNPLPPLKICLCLPLKF